MNWRNYLTLGILELGLLLAVSAVQKFPGYMDADYYFAGGQRLAQGYGFSEQIVWNFLDDPQGLPHPSHGYWMPLVSILAGAGMALLGNTDFASGRIFPLALAVLVPPLTAALSWRLVRRKDAALLSGGFAILAGFYLPYLPTTDAFGLYMVLGALFLLLVPGPAEAAADSQTRLLARFFGLGLGAGLMHLARADGLLWLLVALIAGALVGFSGGLRRHVGAVWAAAAAGYLLVMSGWFARNLAAFGVPLSPGGARGLWILKYDELFLFPASPLTLQRWLEAGLAEIIRVRLWAAGQNLLSAVAVQGAVFLTPLILIGLWQLRRDRRVQVGAAAWAITFLGMTLIFPFQGVRGGFFHSAAAVQPLLWAAVPLGLAKAIEAGARWRGWDLQQARRVFEIGSLILALAFTAFLTIERLGLGSGAETAWNRTGGLYARLEQRLESLGAAGDQVVLVNNPPAYFSVSDRPAVSIPFGKLASVCAAAEKFKARYLLLEIDQILDGEDLYRIPHDRLCLRHLETFEDVQIYEVRQP